MAVRPLFSGANAEFSIRLAIAAYFYWSHPM